MDAQKDATKTDSQVIYVDELAGEGDYWLSITDAARVTRRQEVSIRRWIAKGDLPVRRRSVGLNRRTRQVRASDLKKVTEIIDPTATITSGEGKLDLVSIPQQQQQILDEYKQATRQMQALSEQLTTLQQATMQQREDATRASTDLQTTLTIIKAQQQEALAALLQQLDAAGTQQTQRTEQLSLHLTQKLETIYTQQEQQTEQLNQQLAEQQTTAKTYQTELLAQHTSHCEAIEHVLSTLTPLFEGHATALDRYSRELQAAFEQHGYLLQALEQRLSASTRELAQQIGSLFDSLTGQLNAITEYQHSYGKAAQTQADTFRGHLITITEQQDASRNAIQVDLDTLRQMIEAQARVLSQITEQQTALYEHIQQITPLSQGQQSLFSDTSLQTKEQRSSRTKKRE